MHRKAVTCRMCHRKFFPASLKFHVKVCAEKKEHINLPCDYCQERFSCTALQAHMKTCARGHKRQAPVGQRVRGRDSLSRDNNTPRREHSDSSARQHRVPTARLTPGDDEKMVTTLLNSLHTRPAKGVVDCAQPGRCGNNSTDDNGEVSNGTVARDDGRVACANCRRKFSPDRVGVHQEICRRVNPNNPIADARGRNTFEERTTSAVRSTRRSSCPALGDDKKTRRTRTELVMPLSHGGDRFCLPTASRAADTMCIPMRKRAAGLHANGTWAVSSGTSPRAAGATLSGRSINHGTSTAIFHVRGPQKNEEQPEARAWSLSRGSMSRPRPSSAVDCASASAAGYRIRTSGRESSSWSPVRVGRGVRSSTSVRPTPEVKGRGYAAVAAGGSFFSCWGGGDDGTRTDAPDEAVVRALGAGSGGSPDGGSTGCRVKAGGAKRGVFVTRPRWT